MMNWNLENSILREYYEGCEYGGSCKYIGDNIIRKNFICGTDEAGRGPLAGDVYAAAVILPHGLEIEGLADSKLLSPKRREKLYDIITEKALAYSIASASIDEIDRINILNAALLAMKRAVATLSIKPDFVLIDGHIVRGFDDYNTLGIVKGDAKSPNIAAASILAKVARDRYMRELNEMYPLYHFERNKGYPTHEHIFRLQTFGECPVHRKSFLKNILSEDFQTQIRVEELQEKV
ncbi:MAG: ribonuclease HII [Oscillospiraceae bacterium]|nr:ribonuclease HII [Oscillospiraceae bacterium]